MRMTIANKTAGADEPAHDFREPISSAPERLRPTEQTSGRRSLACITQLTMKALSSAQSYITRTKKYKGESRKFSRYFGYQVLASEFLVRSSAFEPPRYCYRQPLKLMRLPVPPRPHIEKHEERY